MTTLFLVLFIILFQQNATDERPSSSAAHDAPSRGRIKPSDRAAPSYSKAGVLRPAWTRWPWVLPRPGSGISGSSAPPCPLHSCQVAEFRPRNWKRAVKNMSVRSNLDPFLEECFNKWRMGRPCLGEESDFLLLFHCETLILVPKNWLNFYQNAVQLMYKVLKSLIYYR